jgi:hypothetical protein
MIWRYLLTTYTYSLARSIPLNWDRKKEYTFTGTQTTIVRQMPVVEKLRDSGFMMLISPVVWPLYAYHDASRLEFCMRGVDPRAYGIDDDFF